MSAIGLDFGTTNSVASVMRGGEPVAVTYAGAEAAAGTFPTLLTFWENQLGERRRDLMMEGGPWAARAYLDQAPEGRLIQSFKSYAASASFVDTRIFGQRFEFENLMTAFVSLMQSHSDAPSTWKTPALVVGRPVRFAGASPDDDLAMKRYRAAFQALGFERILTVYEPLAAAYFFVRKLTGKATVFVADLGGGTSDFSIVRFSRRDGETSFEPLASLGLDVAGDAFDFRIVDSVVCHALGKGSEYQSMGKILEVPNAYYANFARWNRLSLMRYTKAFRELKALAHQSLSPEKINRLIAFLESESAYDMFAAVTKAKRDLSAHDEAVFELKLSDKTLTKTITRKEFDGWIAADLDKLSRLADDTLAAARLQAGDIDAVFLTGGSSFVPAVRGLFESRFGAGKITSGDELVSIAYGLALIGANPDEQAWAAEALTG